MINFLKSLPYGKVIPLYVASFFIISAIGLIKDFGWYGTKLSLPIIVTFLILDLTLTYIKYGRGPRT